jgi:hypothetical protein
MVSAAFLASAYVLSSTCLSKMSASGSKGSSWIDSMVVYRVFLLTGIAEFSFCLGALSGAGMLLSSSHHKCLQKTYALGSAFNVFYIFHTFPIVLNVV